MSAARRTRSIGTAQLALLLAAGCSLQDFDYLQQGAGGSSSAGTSSAAGTSTAGTENGEGGEGATPTAGGKGGTAPSGGTKSGGSDSGGTNPGGADAGGAGIGGTDGTGELVNGSFETNSTAGWTVEPEKALQNPPRYAFVQPPPQGAFVFDGSYEFSTWHAMDSYTVHLYQTIEGLADGTYRFKGYFNLGAGHNSVEIYAADCGGEDPEPTMVPAAGPRLEPTRPARFKS
jgi:hypothetical protein